MTKPVIGRGMYGMYGPVTDPGEREFSAKVAALGVDIGQSPYRDYEVNQIVADLNATPNAVHIIWGSSLGANNCPLVALYAPHIIVHGMWGFQASLDGAQVKIPRNVLFAHEVWNPNWIMTFGLGAYEWQLASGNTQTNLYTSKRSDFHPGETEAVQTMFLAEIQRVIATAGRGMMTIDPRWSFWLSIILATLSFLGGAGSQFADLGLSPAIVKAILAAIAIVVGIGNSFNAVLAAIPGHQGADGAKQFYLGPKPKDPPA